MGDCRECIYLAVCMDDALTDFVGTSVSEKRHGFDHIF